MLVGGEWEVLKRRLSLPMNNRIETNPINSCFDANVLKILHDLLLPLHKMLGVMHARQSDMRVERLEILPRKQSLK